MSLLCVCIWRLVLEPLFATTEGKSWRLYRQRDPLVACSEEAEILAGRHAVEFALECGFTKLVLEGDNQAIMTALSSRRGLVSQLGHIIQDVICMLNNLRWSQVLFAKRSANTVAHALARYAKDLIEDVVWIEDSPPPSCGGYVLGFYFYLMKCEDVFLFKKKKMIVYNHVYLYHVPCKWLIKNDCI